MNTDEPREMDMQVATISVRRWIRAWHHLCQLPRFMVHMNSTFQDAPCDPLLQWKASDIGPDVQ